MMLTGTIILIAVGMDIVRQSGSPLAVRRFLLGASSACIILDDDKIADQQARFGANAPLLLALVLTTIAGIWATLKMGRPVELAFSALLVVSCVFAVVAGKLSLVPLLILGAVLLAGAQFVLMLAERAKALADMRMA